MTLQDFFEKVKGKKIRFKSWPKKEWFEPHKLRSDGLIEGTSSRCDSFDPYDTLKVTSKDFKKIKFC